VETLMNDNELFNQKTVNSSGNTNEW